MLNCRMVLLLSCLAFPVSATAQNGASYVPGAKKPAITDADRPMSPQWQVALGWIASGNVNKGIPALKALADTGDVKAMLWLAGLYRGKSALPLAANPSESLRYDRMASAHGSGEASEQIAEMLENKEVPLQPEGDATTWRSLATKQGWVQEDLTTIIYEWTRDPEPLHCNTRSTPPDVLEKFYKGHPPEQCPPDSEMNALRAAGLTGILRSNGGGRRNRAGPKARAVLIMDHPVPGEEDLREPYATSVLYIQTAENRWRMIPPNAPLLGRYMILEPSSGNPLRSSMKTQDVDGSSTGGDVGPIGR